MMILRFSPSSPFVRKVRIAVALLGFEDEVTLERADTTDPNDLLRRTNPLGKIPVLIVEDGSAIYDLRVILDYLDERAGGGKIVPRDVQAAARCASPASFVRRHPRCLDPHRLRRPLSQAGHARAQMARSAGRQGFARARRARSGAACARPACPMSGRSRSPARSAIATSVSAVAGAASIRGLSPGSIISPRACPPSRRPSPRGDGVERRDASNKKPRSSRPGVLVWEDRSGASEPIIDAAAEQIGGER